MRKLTRQRLLTYTSSALFACFDKPMLTCFITYECPTENYIKNIMEQVENNNCEYSAYDGLPEEEINSIKLKMVEDFKNSPRYNNGEQEGTTLFLTTCLLQLDDISPSNIKHIIEDGKKKIEGTKFIRFDTEVNFLRGVYGKRVLGELYDDFMTMYDTGVKDKESVDENEPYRLAGEYASNYGTNWDETVKAFIAGYNSKV